MWIIINFFFSFKSNKCYVCRCVVDVWVGVIWKVRLEGLVWLMELLMEDNVDGMEVVWVYSLKGSLG